MYRQNSKDKNSKINKMSFVPSISPEPRLRPGTRDTRQLETTFVKYQEFFCGMISNTLLVLNDAGDIKNDRIHVDRYQEIFRDMISEHMIDENSGDHIVGGPGCTVEVDVAQYGSC